MRHANVKTTVVNAQLDPTRTAEVVHSVGLTGLGDDPRPAGGGQRPAVLRLVRDAG